MTETEKSDICLSVRNLSVRFRTAQGDLHALDNVSLEVARSQTLAIVGESGSGKSVLSRSILRLLGNNASTAAKSEIHFNGRNLLRLDDSGMRAIRGKRIGMVFQDPMTALNPVRTIGSQLMEAMRLHLRLSAKESESRSVELLNQVGIPSPARRMKQYPHELSGGMRQRVVIAMAISCEPELLIADEPTTALDVTVQAEILELLQELKTRRRMTMILVTHDLGVAAGHADEIAVMYAGQLVEKAPTRKLFGFSRMPYTRDLLKSVPRMEDPPHSKLHTISGRPPTVRSLGGGCRYAGRCQRAVAECHVSIPLLEHAAQEHLYRCHFPMEAR